jgi:uncharacterized protein Usg
MVIPVQAKVGTNRLGIVQVWQDYQLCREHHLFKHLTPRLVGAQAIDDDTIGLFEVEMDGYGLTLVDEKRYSLVSHSQISDSELEAYRRATDRDKTP